MKWDNLAIIGIAGAISAVVVPLILGIGGTSTPTKPAAITQANDRQAAVDDSIASTMTIEQANQLVEQARIAMSQGRFGEAAQLLAQIGGPVGDESGASALRDENARRRAEHEQLSTSVVSAVEQHDWTSASTMLQRLRELAPLTAYLSQLDRRATRELAAANAYQGALDEFERGNARTALTRAQRDYLRFKTQELATLVDRIEKELARAGAQSGQATAGGATSTGPGTGTGATISTYPPAGTGVTAGTGTIAGLEGLDSNALNAQALTALNQLFGTGGAGGAGATGGTVTVGGDDLMFG